MAYQSKYSGLEIDEAIGKVGSKLDQTGDASNTTVDFEEATDRLELGKKDTLSVLIGKISKWLKGLKNVAFSGSYKDLSDKPTIPSEYTLPKASSSTLGGIKIGANLTISDDGTVDAVGGASVDTSNFATKDKYGDTAISLGRRLDTGSVGTNSVATGDRTQANGNYSVAMGSLAQANAMAAVALGREVRANSSYSVALGEGTITKRQGSVAMGTWNVEDTSGELVHTVGNGTSSSARSNAHTVDTSGNAWYQGDVYVGSTSGTNKDAGSKKLATESYVDSAVANAGGEISNAADTLMRIDKIDVKTQQVYENMQLVEGTVYLIIENEE